MKTANVRKTPKPFMKLTAADLMTAAVVSIPDTASLCEAAKLLTSRQISGAPVVDAEGKCIGVLSSKDFVTQVSRDGDAGRSVNHHVTAFIAPWGEVIDIEDCPETEIRQYMTARLVSVQPSTPLGELCEKMLDAHIHRVLVVDAHQRAEGIVTTTDVLAAIVRASQVTRSAKR